MAGRTAIQHPLKRHGQVLLIPIGVASIVTMPVDYRGGASLAHPHTTAQLLIDLSHGSLDHHAGHSHRGNWSAHHWRRSSPSRQQPQLSTDPARSWTSPISRFTVEALIGRTTATKAATLGSDAPSVSPRPTVLDKLLVAAALVAAIAMFHWRRPSSRLHWRRRPAWTGLLWAPEPPPPRSMAPIPVPSLSA